MISLKAYAKINMTLEVLRRRPDGYHDIRSIFQAVSLCDTIKFADASVFSIKCDVPEWSAEKSLVGKAVQLLRESTAGKKGAAIEIQKRIPLLSGLGGDSSDAVAVLRGLNNLWNLHLPDDKLLSMAASLGADVPFFLRGGTALAEGRGDIITPLHSFPRMWVVLVLPGIAVAQGKTTRMYTALRPSHFTDGSITQRFLDTLRQSKSPDLSSLFNSFENIAYKEYPGLDIYKEHLAKLGAPHVHLAGSGPTLYTLFLDRAPAQDLYHRCQKQGMKILLAKTI